MITKRNTVLKESLGDKIYSYINIFLLIAIGVITLYPFLNVVAVSISGRGFVARGEVGIIPKGITFAAYKKIWDSGALNMAYLNTIYTTVITTVLGLTLTTFLAYPLSKKSLPGRKGLTLFVSITMWFHAGMIPSFLVMQRLGLLDTLSAVILSQLVAAYNVIVMIGFFSNIPESLEESAKLDGANDIMILFKIVLPLSMPVLATVALWIAVAQWNNFFQALIYLQSREKFTLQIVLRDIVLSSSSADYGMIDDTDAAGAVTESIRYATILVATVPVLIIYPFVQKYFVKGVMIGSVKG